MVIKVVLHHLDALDIISPPSQLDFFSFACSHFKKKVEWLLEWPSRSDITPAHAHRSQIAAAHRVDRKCGLGSACAGDYEIFHTDIFFFINSILLCESCVLGWVHPV